MPKTPLPHVREAGFDDIESIRALADLTWKQSYPGIISGAQIDYMLSWMYSATQIREEMSTGAITYLLAEKRVDGSPTPVGFAAFGAEDIEDAYFLHKLYISPAEQRSGIGSLLLAEIEERLPSDRPISLSLRVNRANQSAIGAYQKYGFEIIREICDSIGQGFAMDDYLMSKRIGPEPT